MQSTSDLHRMQENCGSLPRGLEKESQAVGDAIQVENVAPEGDQGPFDYLMEIGHLLPTTASASRVS